MEEEDPELEDPETEDPEVEDPDVEDPEVEDPTDEMDDDEEEEEEEEETEVDEPEEEEEEEESGFAAVISKLLDIFRSLFGLGGDNEGNGNGRSDPPEAIEDKIDELETLLTDLLPETETPDTTPAEEDDEELADLAA